MYIREMENIEFLIIFFKRQEKGEGKETRSEKYGKGKTQNRLLALFEDTQSHEQIIQFSKRHIMYSLLCAQGF